MDFLIWVFTIVCLYVALGRLLFVLTDSIRRRRFYGVLLVAVGLVVSNIITSLWAAFAQIDRPHYHTLAPFIIISHCLILLAVLQFEALSVRKLSWQEIKGRKETAKQVRLHLALVTGALIFSFPLYWLVTTSLKPDDRVRLFPPDLIPMYQERASIGGEERTLYWLTREGGKVRVAKMAELENDKWQVRVLSRSDGPGFEIPAQRNVSAQRSLVVPSKQLRPVLHPTVLWANYSDALGFLPPEYNKGLGPLWNTVYVTILVIVGTVFSSSLVAFSFARLRWPGRDLLFVVLLATMMIPAAVTMLPVFLIFRWLGWVDTLRPLWFPALFGSAFNVFLLRQFFMTIPNDLEDAAKIDGCSYFAIYWRIMLPLIKPALAAITIFAFMGSWNNFMGPLIYISSPEKMTLAYALQLFQGTHGGEPAMMMAAATLVMLPVLAVFFFTQRYMIQGVTLTGIKG